MATVTVSSWADFVSAVAVSGDTVSIAADTVWDMNEISPTGVGGITINCAEIIGNDAVIKAANITSSLFTVNANCQIKRLSILDFDAKAPVIETGNSANVVLKKCALTGMLNKANETFFYCASGSITFTADDPSFAGEDELGCVINVVDNGAGFAGAYYAGTAVALIYTRLHYVGTKFDGERGRYHGVTLNDSYVTGELGLAEFSAAQRSIINATGTISGNGAAQTLVNTDRATIASGAYIGVTTEELQDTEYLQSVGFPIGDD